MARSRRQQPVGEPQGIRERIARREAGWKSANDNIDVELIVKWWPPKLRECERPRCRAGSCSYRLVPTRVGDASFMWSCPNPNHPSRNIDAARLLVFLRAQNPTRTRV